MNQIFAKSIETAQHYVLKTEDSAHDLDHTREVVTFAIEISKRVNYPNIELIEVAAWWHDVGRLFDSVHEEISGKMAKENLTELGCNHKEANLVYEAIRFHKWNMNPTCLEGDIIRDADKLQFISIKRWKKCIKTNEYTHIKPIIPLLPELRNILKLEVSKSIYDEMIGGFVNFIKDIKTSDEELSRMVDEIDSLNLTHVTK
jgi:HD superfamily phosphodiesterase